MRSTQVIECSALIAGLVAVLAGCSGLGAGPDESQVPVQAPASPAGDRAELISIGSGREISLECRGQGEPTVVFISGTGGAADEWMVAADPAEPTGAPQLSDRSVFDVVTRATRVCAYDRPGTTLADGQLTSTTAVSQPTSAHDAADDLERLLAASGEDTAGSMVLVGASWGGLIAQLYARTHPNQVMGLVLIDSASTHLGTSLAADQWEAWMALIAASADGVAERPNYVDSMEQLNSAPVVPDIGTEVLSSDHPWDLGVTPGRSTWPSWLAAQEVLAEEWRAVHVSETDSGHVIHVEQPALVAAIILEMVADVRQ